VRGEEVHLTVEPDLLFWQVVIRLRGRQQPVSLEVLVFVEEVGSETLVEGRLVGIGLEVEMLI
jgi:hypothetical protein